VTGYLVLFDQDSLTGFPINPEEFSRDLARKVTALLADSAKARSFGEAGRRRVEEKFSWTAIAEQTIELYRILIENSKR